MKKNIFKEIENGFVFDNTKGLLNSSNEIVAELSDINDSKRAIIKLTHYYYKKYYSKSQTLNKSDDFQEISIETDKDFINRLIKIFPNKKIISNGWRVVGIVSKDILRVEKNGITLTVNTHLHLPKDLKITKIHVNDIVSILFSCHFPNISNGFYVFKSEIGEIDKTRGVGRFYFNANYNYVVDFTEEILSNLYNNNIIFDFKVFKNIRNEYRIDSAVLYFSLEDFEIIRKIISLLSNNELYFNKEVSMFHHFVSNGIGFAEEPTMKKENESYGLNRCRILSEITFNSLDDIKKNGKIPWHKFDEQFKYYQLDFNNIFLNPQSRMKKLLNLQNN